ncbi:hypothetical protein [Streptomyces sp. 1222.5]|uniref:hypothetical protein n=1 Tax=Streptomyces sp. 1222.5 TaxID=1881026 RepID=UPI003EB7D41B
MTPSERRHLAAVEQELSDASRELRAARAQLTALRAWLLEEAPELARAEQDAARIMRELRARPRPALEVLEGAAVVDASGALAVAVADQTPPWSAHSDRVAGRARRAPRRARHGLHAVD